MVDEIADAETPHRRESPTKAEGDVMSQGVGNAETGDGGPLRNVEARLRVDLPFRANIQTNTSNCDVVVGLVAPLSIAERDRPLESPSLQILHESRRCSRCGLNAACYGILLCQSMVLAPIASNTGLDDVLRG